MYGTLPQLVDFVAIFPTPLLQLVKLKMMKQLVLQLYLCFRPLPHPQKSVAQTQNKWKNKQKNAVDLQIYNIYRLIQRWSTLNAFLDKFLSPYSVNKFTFRKPSSVFSPCIVRCFPVP